MREADCPRPGARVSVVVIVVRKIVIIINNITPIVYTSKPKNNLVIKFHSEYCIGLFSELMILISLNVKHEYNAMYVPASRKYH